MQRYEFFIYIMVIVDKALMQVKKKQQMIIQGRTRGKTYIR